VGIVKVPDERLEKIAAISKPKKIIPATIEFVDIAGLVKGAHEGEGLGNKFLANIRECDAICEVVRDFENSDIVHVGGKIDPEEDKETVNMELIFADLQTVEKRFDKVKREAKSGKKEFLVLADVLERLKNVLDKGMAARTVDLTEDERSMIRDLNLLTMKPIIYVVNVNDQTQRSGRDWDGELVYLNIKQEEEIASLPEEEQAEYVTELGLEESGLDKLIKASYRLLGLITYFTTGPDETRAWTIEAGWKGPQAAGVIHTDFEKGYIRAEVINWEKFLEAGGETAAREKGLIRTEGKEYVMADGDICNFLIN
jgi:ribosome-binding ATPase